MISIFWEKITDLPILCAACTQVLLKSWGCEHEGMERTILLLFHSPLAVTGDKTAAGAITVSHDSLNSQRWSRPAGLPALPLPVSEGLARTMQRASSSMTIL